MINLYLLNGIVSELETKRDYIPWGRHGRGYDAQNFYCRLGKYPIYGIFTTLQFKNGHTIKVIYKYSFLKQRIVLAILNLENGMLHLHPAMGLTKRQTLIEIFQLGIMVVLFLCLFFSFFIIFLPAAFTSVVHWEDLKTLVTISIIVFSPIVALVCLITYFMTISYAKQTCTIFKMLNFPNYKTLVLYKFVRLDGWRLSFFSNPAVYKERKKIYYGVYDCYKIFHNHPLYLNQNFNKKQYRNEFIKYD